MSEIPKDLLYTSDHEWLRLHADGTATVGITDYAQESLGDITFVEFPEPGASFQVNDTFGVVESVKAASDLYMPVTAEVTEINDKVDASPELINEDPYGEGWLLKIKIQDIGATDDLLKSDAYSELI
ncbi:MAG: glycine cleavage system protein GcvH [Verrucomicrobiota bacterium]